MDSDDKTLLDVLRRWGEVQPDAPAILAEGAAPLSYGALVARIDGIRAAIHESGFGRGDRLAIVHRGGAGMAVTMMGAMSTAAIAPISHESTAAEFENQFRIRKVDGLILDRDLGGPARSVAAGMGLPVLEVEPADPAVAGAVRLLPAGGGKLCDHSPPGPENVAYVVTTSGTTSRGKVVPVKNRNLVARCIVYEENIELSSKDRMLHLVPLYYASGLLHFFGVLRTGGSIVFMPVGEMQRFFDYLERFDPTWYTGSPTVQEYVRERASHRKGVVKNKSLRFVRSSSSRLDPELALELERILGVPVITSYSSAESGSLASNPLPPGKRKHGSVGLSISGEVGIMDDAGRLLPTGTRGEVVARNARMFDGYEDDPEANAAAFTDGWFRTGDEGYFDEDGYLFLCGRIKEIINCGGEKVYPLEVDAALMSLPGVRDAAVFPAPHPTLGEMVAAAIVMEAGKTLDARDASGILRDKLSRFKIPRRYLFLESLPRSPAGKIQRNRLAEILAERLGNDAGMETPAAPRQPTKLEAELLKIFALTLSRNDIGLDDDFYEKGGDSLRAIGLFLEIERKLGLILPAGLSAEASSVAELAVKIEAGATRRCLVPIQPAGTRYPLFFVPGRYGEVVGLLSLAQALGTDQPFYGFQTYVWLDANDPYPVTSTAELVKLYVEEIRAVQPTGPYFIGGRSFGGRIAFYIARELVAAGEEVALLAIGDSYCRAGRMYIGWRQWLTQESGPGMLQSLLSAARFARFRTTMSACRLRDRIRKEAVHAVWRICRRFGLRPPLFSSKPTHLMNMLIRFEHKHMRPYEGPAVYFKAALGERSTLHPDVHEAWHRLFPNGLEVREVTGHHYNFMREPHVRGLAAQLDACLRDHGIEGRRESAATAGPGGSGAPQAAE